MPLPKGSLVICDGNGNTSYVSPGTDNQAIIADSTQPNGVRFGNVGSVSAGFVRFAITSKSVFRTSNFETALTFTFPGADKGAVSKITVISDMSNNSTSYDIRIYDITNDLIIASNTYTNTTPNVNELTPISNLPGTDVIAELQIRLNSSNNKNRTVFIKELSILYS